MRYKLTPEAENDLIELTSGDADIDASGDATFNGPIEIRRGQQFLGAESAEYDSQTTIFTLEGEVRYKDPESELKGGAASYNCWSCDPNLRASTPARSGYF